MLLALHVRSVQWRKWAGGGGGGEAGKSWTLTVMQGSTSRQGSGEATRGIRSEEGTGRSRVRGHAGGVCERISGEGAESRIMGGTKGSVSRRAGEPRPEHGL